ncbi:MAG: short-chain dehydrogenase [Chitinophagaceae bacterium]|nr:MAG: short-chain dehydrogenase [Chitinophagaceae bacterium]
MTSEQIEKFIGPKIGEKHKVKIDFKTRNSIKGIFIQANDYTELKSKNFWRIVTEMNIEKWKESGDYNLGRIFNGTEFTKLSAV